MSITPSESAPFCPPDRRKYVLVATILASSMAFIDGSVISIATPAIRADLGAGLAEAQWVSNGYMLFLASLIMIGGAAGDRFGLRRVFGIGIGLFVTASLICAVAPSPFLLILARGLQGIAAAFMVPGSLALIAKAYPKDERGKAIGTWAAASSLTTILGPVIGGFVLGALGDWSWRLVFAINLPLGLIALWLLLARVPADVPEGGRRLDVAGGLLATAGLLCVTLALTGEGGEAGQVDPTRLIILMTLGVALLVGFLFWEEQTPHPMMPLNLFAARGFSGANGLTFALYFALAAISFYLPMTAIAGWGVNPAEVAVSFLPIGIALTLLSALAGRLADRHGPGPLITAGSVLVALGFAGLALLTPLQSIWLGVLPPMTVMGIGMGLVVSPLSTAVMTAVSDGQTGIASSVNNAVARAAGLFAVALMGGVAALVFQAGVAETGAVGLSFGQVPLPGQLGGESEAARVGATNMAFMAVALTTSGLALVSAVIAWTTLERKPRPDRNKAGKA
jgi:EmrB/QacA subfamily drug resistance transporter